MGSDGFYLEYIGVPLHFPLYKPILGMGMFSLGHDHYTYYTYITTDQNEFVKWQLGLDGSDPDFLLFYFFFPKHPPCTSVVARHDFL